LNDLLRFETGDLSGKYGSLRAENSVIRKIDPTFLPKDLQHRSLVVHDQKGVRVACGNLVAIPNLKPIRGLETQIKNQKGLGVIDVKMIEVPTPLIPSGFLASRKLDKVLKQVPSYTFLFAKPSGFDQAIPFGFHIHQKKVINNKCDTTGGHYQKSLKGFNNQQIPGDWTTFETGDLSGKNGKFNSKQDAFIALDPTFSIQDVQQLSLVIHSPKGDKYGCSNLVPLSLPKVDLLYRDGAKAVPESSFSTQSTKEMKPAHSFATKLSLSLTTLLVMIAPFLLLSLF
jgi:hypothetical protein